MQASTVFETLWAIVLGRFTGTAEIVIGHECDGRASAPELEHAVGLLAKTLPIHLNVESTTPLGLLLREADSAIRDALRWEEYYTAESLGLAFRLPYRFEYEVQSATQLPEQFSIRDIRRSIEPFDITLGCVRSGDEVALEFRFDSSRYRESDVSKLADHYYALLDSAIKSPTAPIGSLDLLPPTDRHQVLIDWNLNESEFSPTSAIHHLF